MAVRFIRIQIYWLILTKIMFRKKLKAGADIKISPTAVNGQNMVEIVCSKDKPVNSVVFNAGKKRVETVGISILGSRCNQ